MSRQNEESQRPARQRANTALNAAFNWGRVGRGRQEILQTPLPEPSPPLSLEALIEALTPPAVPSLTHARTLANTLANQSPLPRLALLTPILAGLCAAESPVNLQSAGYEILAAYCSNTGSAVLNTADRLSCFSLFLNHSTIWVLEVWESRLKALIALINSGMETVGLETTLLKVLRVWIQEAFSGMNTDEAVSQEERTERRRSVEAMIGLLMSLVGRSEFVSRLSEHDVNGVVHLFGNLIDGAMVAPTEIRPSLPSPLSELTLNSPSASRTQLKHHRHQSSVSMPPIATTKNPIDLAVESYLNYLDIRIKAIAPIHLKTILPYLFRALAYYHSPLPRVSLDASSPHEHPLERRLTEVLNDLVMGPYSASCTVLLKLCLFPSEQNLETSTKTALGALRTLRTSIRRVLYIRLARAYIARTSSINYTPSGAPGNVDLERGLFERAWASDDIAVWDLNRFRSVLCRAVKSWIKYLRYEAVCETFLNELAGILKDITQAFDESGDEADYEEVDAVGELLQELSRVVRLQKNTDGTPIRISLSQVDAPTTFLTTLSSLLAQDLTVTPLYSVLPPVILSIADHITDSDTTQLLVSMSERQSFSPTTPAWLDNWHSVLSIPDLYTPQRPTTRHVVMNILQSVWEFVKDISVYRRPLASVVFNFWRNRAADLHEDQTALILWRILGDEIVFRSVEDADEGSCQGEVEEQPAENVVDAIVDFLQTVANEPQAEESNVPTGNPDLLSPSSSTHAPISIIGSPVLSRMQSEFSSPIKEKEAVIPSMISLFSSLTSGNSSRAQSQPPRNTNYPTTPETPQIVPPEQVSMPRTVGAVVALVSAFSQLAFTSIAVNETHLELATRLFSSLVSLLGGTGCTKAKLTVLQFLMRLRVDRDHKLYFASADHDKDGLIALLASLIGRTERSGSAVDERPMDEFELRRARARPPQERSGRRLSRGRGGQPSKSESSRSRSRATSRAIPSASVLRKLAPREPLWMLPEALPFLISAEADTPSERLISYDPASPAGGIILPLSSYLTQVANIIKSGKDWDLLSYIFCHLPTQLANKHLFCGPKSRVVLNDLLATLCSGILEGRLATSIERWPDGVIPRDAQGLAFHTLTVLISYKQCFQEIHLRHSLVEVFLVGLSGQPSTIRCCLHALALSAFELQPSMTKFLPRILEKLSQIMSNPAMAVHIIDFLAIVGSLRILHSNFTEMDYKMVFGVALQYLQHHNRPEAQLSISWALSQHVRIMSYYIVYLWFLAVKLPDRPRHIKYITRQLLLANEGRAEVDEPTEVCFDWLARYTYASADPRPANSMLNDIVMNPLTNQNGYEPSISEKTWLLGNSVVTIRTLAKRGWVEVLSRRASGLTKFLCRAENVPMVTPGDVDPDMISVAASLTMDRQLDERVSNDSSSAAEDIVKSGENPEEECPPDPITGYVWSGSAPSQRRKKVSIEPGYFALQLSSYPDTRPSNIGRMIADTSKLQSFFRTFDRMPVIDTHKVGIMYVAPGQDTEETILANTHGSPAYTRFLEGLGRLIYLRGQVDVYDGGLDPDEDGDYAYAWWDDIGQVLFHTATLMPADDTGLCTNKKRHIGNDYVRIIWNDSGKPYRFDTLATQFQFVNIVVEPHSRGAMAAYSDNLHENEYFKVCLQRAEGMPEFTPLGEFKLISAEKLPLLVRQLSLLANWFAIVFDHTKNDTDRVEMMTNWRSRLQAIKRFKGQTQVGMVNVTVPDRGEGIMGQEVFRDFTSSY